MATIRVTVNGQPVEADIDGRVTLADFLRERCDARSIHLGCEHGVCGACTVLVNGLTARSCIALAATLDGAEVQTLEGLAGDPVIAALKAGFTREHGLQCGYCTPAMLIVARDILAANPDPDEAEVREKLAGQICRCTGYSGIVRAIRAAAQDLSPRSAGS